MKLYRKKDIKVNGKRVSKNCELCVNDVIEVFFNETPQNLDVIFCDRNVLVVNKPSGITSEDFYERVKGFYNSALFTHRLDRNTFGIMIFALNQKAYDELFYGFKNRTFDKYYYCLVYGKMPKQSAVLKDYLFKDAKKATVIVTSEKVKGSLPIETYYEVIKSGEISTVLKVKLITGRTHQIRAHLAYYGNFIIGDGKYGKESINKTFKQRTQLLTSGELTLHFKSDDTLYYLDNTTFEIPKDNIFEKLQ